MALPSNYADALSAVIRFPKYAEILDKEDKEDKDSEQLSVANIALTALFLDPFATLYTMESMLLVLHYPDHSNDQYNISWRKSFPILQVYFSFTTRVRVSAPSRRNC